MQKKAIFTICLSGIAVLLSFFIAVTVGAKTKNADIITVNPATDGGRYITVHQSQTLSQWGFNAGTVFDFGYKPLKYSGNTGARPGNIVDNLLVANIQAAAGFTPWLTAGFNVPLAIHETYYDPAVLTAAVSKESFYGKMGDARVEMKFRLLDIDRYKAGISLVPFMYFPTGKSTTFLGNGMWSPGATLVFDTAIRNRFFFSFNAGYRNYEKTRYNVNNANAVIDDTLLLAGGVNMRIDDSWAIIGEIWSESVLSAFFKNQLQNPAEFLVAGRFTPQSIFKGLGITLGGGRGITSGAGSPDARLLAGINYRHIPPPAPAAITEPARETPAILQKIYFMSGATEITPSSYPAIDEVSLFIDRNPYVRKVRIEGHADGRGSSARNEKLSLERALAVRDYLIGKGVEAARLEAAGFGELSPAADNSTSAGRAQNRRVEFTILEY